MNCKDFELRPMRDIVDRAVMCNLLPPDARLELKKAASIDPHLPPGASFERSKALDRALMRVRFMYPKHFQTGDTP